MKPGLDLAEAIYGTIMPDTESDTLEEGSRVTLLLFQAGGTALKPNVVVDTVRISEIGEHLEEFTGIDDTHPGFDDDLSRGSSLAGVYNQNTSTVFITSIDGQPVAVEPDFYNANPPTDK